MSDETSDKGGRCVYNILCETLDPGANQSIHLLASVVLDSADSASCAKAVIETLARYEIEYDHVIAFVTDAARYMTNCNRVPSGLIEHMIHIQCWAHKIHLVGVIWQESLEELNNVVVKVKNAFLNTRKRKNHYAKYLSEKYRETSGKVKQFPIPVLTRWNSWFHSVDYINSYLRDIIAFFKDLEITGDGNAGIKFFKLISAKDIQVVEIQAIHVKMGCSNLVELITFLEGTNYPTGHLVHGKVDDLCSEFTIMGNGHFPSQVGCLLKKLPTMQQAQVGEQLKATAKQASVKLKDLKMNDPGRRLWCSLSQGFNPQILGRQMPPMQDFVPHLTYIPFVSKLDTLKFQKGYIELRRVVHKELREAACNKIDLVNVVFTKIEPSRVCSFQLKGNLDLYIKCRLRAIILKIFASGK